MKAKPLVIPPSPGAKVEVLPALDSALAEGIKSGRPVLIFARNSANGGAGARRACVLDACQVVDDLARFGLDVRHLMPPQEALDEWLRSAPPMRSKDARTGNAFQNRFVEVWLTHQVMLGLSVGTGSRLAEETLSQPFLDYLSSRVATAVPVLLHGKRWDRLGRRKWGLGPSLEAMKTRPPSFLGQEDGIERVDEASELRAFIAGDQAERFAEKIPRQTRRGMRSRTGESMRDGYVAYSLPAPPPPGLCRVRMQSGGVSANGEVRMYFEAPQWMPDPAHVAVGFPKVTDPSTGLLVNQVENVRWALERLADPRWSFERIGEGLIARRFSHTRTRQNHGIDAISIPRPHEESQQRYRYRYPLNQVVKPIITNLAVYETGILTRTLGVNGVEDVQISGVVPPDGPWASPEVFAAIRKRLKSRSERRGETVMLLSRIPVTINDQEGALQQYPKSRTEPCYGFWDLERDCPIPVGTTIRHTDLAEIIAEALDLAVQSGAALPLLGDQTQEDPTLEQARQSVKLLEIRRSDAQQRLDRIFQRMDDPQMDGPLLGRLTQEYNSLLSEGLPLIDRELEVARTQVSQIEDDLSALAGSAVERLDELVRALASPWAGELRHEVRSLIHSLSVRMERVVPHRHFRGFLAHIDVELALRDSSDDVYLVRHSRSIPLSGLRRFEEHVEERRKLLAAGVPPREHRRRVRGGGGIDSSDLGNILGMSDHQRPILKCADPRLLRLTFAVFEADLAGRSQEDGVVEELAERFGEPIPLVARCWDLYGPNGTKTGRWQRLRRPADPSERFCESCGVLMLWPLIDEVDGGVCPACRRDCSDVEWPTHYDQWLTDRPSFRTK